MVPQWCHCPNGPIARPRSDTGFDPSHPQNFGKLYLEAIMLNRDNPEVAEVVAEAQPAARSLYRNPLAHFPVDALRRLASACLWSNAGKKKYTIMIMESQEVGNPVFPASWSSFWGQAKIGPL